MRGGSAGPGGARGGWTAVRTCRGPASPAALPGRWTPAPPPPAAAPCRDRDEGQVVASPAPLGWGCGAPGKGELPIRRLRFLTGRRHLSARPGNGTSTRAHARRGVARRRGGGGWPGGERGAAGAEWGEVRPTRGPAGAPTRAWGSSCPEGRGGEARPLGSGVAKGAALPSQRLPSTGTIHMSAGVGVDAPWQPVAEGKRGGEGVKRFLSLLTGCFASAAQWPPP